MHDVWRVLYFLEAIERLYSWSIRAVRNNKFPHLPIEGKGKQTQKLIKLIKFYCRPAIQIQFPISVPNLFSFCCFFCARILNENKPNCVWNSTYIYNICLYRKARGNWVNFGIGTHHFRRLTPFEMAEMAERRRSLEEDPIPKGWPLECVNNEWVET